MPETANNNNNNNMLYIIIIVVLVLLSILSFFIWKKFSDNWDNWNTNNKETTTQTNLNKDLVVTIITDKRCTKCQNKELSIAIWNIEFLKWNDFIELDFSDPKVKQILKDNEIKYLPAVLLSTNNIDDNWVMKPYLKETKAWNFLLETWSEFDPFAEICWNKIDDDKNWKTDCEDSACEKELECMKKVERPKAELFIMSYCPYWTQAQKGFLKVMDKLKDVADMQIRFVPYIMHWDKEWQENIVQYCIQKEQNDKYLSYLQCFLKEWDNNGCLKETKIETEKLDNCIESTKKEISYSQRMAEWRQYPLFDIDKDDAMKYWVQWSPSFVLNWIKVDRIWRSAKAYADIICDSFIEKPEVCNEEFSNITYDPNFWFTSQWQNVNSWWCGG